ncbi:MAG: hypothetical protein IJS12_00640 [Lachnospiraceae bacterium]|nr:hypothetical protein [Lachnospiraceae bacterium]
MKTLTGNEEMRDRYWRKPMDMRKQLLVLGRNIWKLIPGIAIGAVLGALLWIGAHRITDGAMYSGYSEFYLDFAMTESGAAYDYYNGYTWNDLMTTDKIASHTLENLNEGSDIAELERVTTAEILSDIRVLRVSFTDSDERKCADIQTATEQALVTFGNEAKEFTQISLIKSVSPEKVAADDRIKQAILLGAILGLLITLGIMDYRYLLDDRIYVPSDISDLGIPLLGISTSDHDEKLESRLNAIPDTTAATDDDTVYIDASEYQSMDGELPSISDSSCLIIRIPYGRVTRSALALMTDRAEGAGAHILGAEITDADSRFYRAYYSFADHKKDTDS